MLDIDLLRNYAAQGLTRMEIANRMGMSYSRTTAVLKEHGIKVKRKPTDISGITYKYKYDRSSIIELRQKGMSYNKIAKILNIPKDQVGSICRDNGFGGVRGDATERNEEEKVKRVVEQAGFDYVGGYKNNESQIDVRCRQCGQVFKRRYHVISQQVNGTYSQSLQVSGCPLCKEAEKKAKEEQLQKQLQEQREAQMLEKENQRKINDSRKANDELEKRLAIHVCKTCGREFCIAVTNYNSKVYCSSGCQTQAYRRHHDRARFKRIYSKKHDNDITLRKLYKRDGGKCYLCGNTCDWNDHVKRSGTFIAGSTYPSIDHVIPLSKGGTHTWDNVKLACLWCNEHKGAAQIPS